MTTLNTAIHTATVQVPDRAATPRGAIAVGLIAQLVIDLMAWNRQRVSRLALVKDAASLRSYAFSIRNSDPSLASDLMAAANRAE